MAWPTFQRVARLTFWAAFVFAYVCAIIPGGPEIGNSDKFTHLLAFGTLAGLARIGWSRRSAAMIGFALLGFGVFIEASQAIPFIHRDAEFADVVADCGGIALGLLLGMAAAALGRRTFAPGAA